MCSPSCLSQDLNHSVVSLFQEYSVLLPSSSSKSPLTASEPSHTAHQAASAQQPPDECKYDVFLSYREQPDYNLVEALYHRLKEKTIREISSDGSVAHRPLRPFLDKASLQRGKPWNSGDGGLPHALCRSAMFVPVISPQTFAEAREPDFVLVEYDMALALLQMGHIQKVLPLFVGKQVAATLPHSPSPSSRVKDKVIEWLQEERLMERLDVPSLRARTAQQTYDEVSNFQGIPEVEHSRNSLDLAGYRVWEDVVTLQCEMVSAARSICSPTPDTSAGSSTSSDLLGDKSTGSDECLFVGGSKSDPEALSGEVRELLRELHRQQDGERRFCKLLLVHFTSLEGTSIAQHKQQCWKDICKNDEPVDFIEEFQRYVRNGHIQSVKLTQWGLQRDQPHEEFPRASFEVITRLVLENLDPNLSEEWQSRFVVKWRRAADANSKDWVPLLDKAESFLRSDVLEKPGIRVLGLYKVYSYVVFLRVPRLLGLLLWQWLECRRWLNSPEFNLCLLASSGGAFLPNLTYWNPKVVAKLPAILKSIVCHPREVLDAASTDLDESAPPGVALTFGRVGKQRVTSA